MQKADAFYQFSQGFVSASAAMETFFYFQHKWGDKEATTSLGWLPIVCPVVFLITFSSRMSNVPYHHGRNVPNRILGFIFPPVLHLCDRLLLPKHVEGDGQRRDYLILHRVLSAIFVFFLLPETGRDRANL
jgi:hypothetical protein